MNSKQSGSKFIRRLLVVGNPEEYHVGGHLQAAARQLALEVCLFDVREAQSGNLWVNRFCHRVINRRPAHLNRFSQKLVELCQGSKPELLLVTGISAPDAGALKAIGGMRIQRANFLTDDPWNRCNSAGFFWRALPEYNVVWSPRRANLEDLRGHGCQRVEYLPFGYNPILHFLELPLNGEERERFACDVVFVGGADADRLPVARALVRSGLNVHLYGGYWDRDAELRPHWHGFVHGRDQRLAVGGAKINICLGRKANRDGHAMRSFEVPAMGGCPLAEDTQEHREIFGEDGKAVAYFDSIPKMIERARWLMSHPAERQRLASTAHALITDGKNTYADRLRTMLDLSAGNA